MKRAIVLMSLLLTGCASHRGLPSAHWNSPADAIRILQDRAHAIRTVSATGLLTLTRPNGESVRFDAALVAQPPSHLRLRAWKFGRAVFDLTLTLDGLWMRTPDDPSMKQKVKSAGVNAGKVAQDWAELSGKFFDRSDLTARRLPRDLLLSAPEDGMMLLCYVDPRSLAPRLYRLEDDGGKTVFTLKLDDYHLHENIPYPHRLQAGSSDGGMVLELTDVQLNTELADRAFQPPRRAEKLR